MYNYNYRLKYYSFLHDNDDPLNYINDMSVDTDFTISEVDFVTNESYFTGKFDTDKVVIDIPTILNPENYCHIIDNYSFNIITTTPSWLVNHQDKDFVMQ